MNPKERADKVRERLDVICGDGPGAVKAYKTRGDGLPTKFSQLRTEARELRPLLPPGSVILTAEERETIRLAVDSAMCGVYVWGKTRALALLEGQE